jgi:hypothetical protein
MVKVVVVTVVQQLMTEFNGDVLEEAKIMAINKFCLKSHGAKWPLEFIGLIFCTEPGMTEAFYILYMDIITCKI